MSDVKTVAEVLSDPVLIGPDDADDMQRARARHVAEFNAGTLERYRELPWDHPTGRVVWVHITKVKANDWNPNAVARHEMRLLHTSISEDGYTMPVVVMWDFDIDRAVIVDGFHRYTIMTMFQDIAETTGGYLPVVLLDKPIADRIASTVRHNRARGKHSVSGMGNLVFQMLRAGESDVSICAKLGLEAEELARLKHITGYSRLYRDVEFSMAEFTDKQIRHKARYKEAHPDESVPANF